MSAAIACRAGKRSNRAHAQLLPPSTYVAKIIASAVDVLGESAFLWPVPEIIDGPLSGRRFNILLIVRHPDYDIQRNAQTALADLVMGAGLVSLRDTADLHGRPFLCRIGVRAGGNFIRGFWSLNSASPCRHRPRWRL
jgi:hypothetical protein